MNRAQRATTPRTRPRPAARQLNHPRPGGSRDHRTDDHRFESRNDRRALHHLLAERWSPRALDPRHELTPTRLTALLEAARWAPSASNTQPWRFAVTLRGSAEHAAVLDGLAPGNRLWAHTASALIVVAAETTGPDGADRPWAVYDTGQAVAHLSVQAQHEGLAVHQLGGFDRDRIANVLAAPKNINPVVVLAVGRFDETVQLAEPFASREAALRQRLPLEALLLGVDTAQAAA